MGLLQVAYNTYENNAELVGLPQANKETLSPVSHSIENAHIEILINKNGKFLRASQIKKEDGKTLIPVTISSANRTGTNTRAHPLSDQLRYLSSLDPDKLKVYTENLKKWVESPYTHNKLQAIFSYIQGGTILKDLENAEVIAFEEDGTLAAGRISGTAYDRCMVRFRVFSDDKFEKTATWEDQDLIQSFIDYYWKQLSKGEQEVCYISGKKDAVSDIHPKGIVPISYGAKLLSANDNSNFTFRGRFESGDQAYNVGYTASQKAHNALRWLITNEGVYIGKRTFFCWNTGKKEVSGILPIFNFGKFNFAVEEKETTFTGYQRKLMLAINGYRNDLSPTDDIVVASLEAATTGRLSVTYFQELTASNFLDNIEKWYESCCWNFGKFGIQAPPIKQIVDCAFGTYRDNNFVTDDKILSMHAQDLIHSLINGIPITVNVVRAITVQAGALHLFSTNARLTLLSTACAVIRKYRNDKYEKENWTMALDENNNNRSYLFGRLLAIADIVERNAYSKTEKEGRETNAMRMQSVFSQRPLYGWRIIHEKLEPYFAKLSYKSQSYYKKLIGEVMDLFEKNDEQWLGKRLEDVYLLGYYHQNSELYRKKDSSKEEETK